MSDEERKAIQAMIDWTVNLLKEVEVESDYGLTAVAWMDQYIEFERSVLFGDDRTVFVNCFGAYFGEAIRRTYGGEWVTEGGWGIEIPYGEGRKAKISCFGKVYKHFNGGTDSILGFYKAIPMLLQRIAANSSDE